MLFFYKNKGNQQSVFYVEVDVSIKSSFFYVLVKQLTSHQKSHQMKGDFSLYLDKNIKQTKLQLRPLILNEKQSHQFHINMAHNIV